MKMNINGHDVHIEANAQLENADLSKACLSLVDLSGANLYGTNLRGADLYKVDLRYANLVGCKGIITFNFERDMGIYYRCKDEYYIKIGCENYTLDYWLNNYKEIGKSYKYSEGHINMYGDMIRLLSNYDLLEK